MRLAVERSRIREINVVNMHKSPEMVLPVVAEKPDSSVQSSEGNVLGIGVRMLKKAAESKPLREIGMGENV